MTLMPSSASPIDWSKLALRLQLHTEWQGASELELQAGELTDPEAMRRWLETYASIIRAQETQVAATYFSGFLRAAALSFQYAMSIWNEALPLTLDRLTVRLVEQGGRRYPILQLDKPQSEPGPTRIDERRHWRQIRLEALYGQTLRPLIDAMSQAAGISAGQLWSQLVIGGYYYLQDALQTADGDSVLQARIRSDYRFLTEELASETFGRKTNPFAVKLRFVEDVKNPAEQIPLKAACCLYYKTDGGTYCYTCPKLNDEQRAQRLAELRA
ncbi:IucA/IucC family C-terminal-domain containing protein [Paenibacillus athensensis]|uniref:Ferric siderophore reductase C-terminal domain-containing protein n=1 Tax=Paenibacillus athensensis TaxID=1967502 RepID=A0A4Y8QBN3_9BACL|nr:(2Fe-2S)-binding protein [Paenibacillus athensensis]